MPARVRLTEIQYALVKAVHDGKTGSMVDIGRAVGVDNRKAGQMVGNAIRSDILAVKYLPDSRQYDLTTLKVTKRGEELFAATDAPKPATAFSKPRQSKRARVPSAADADAPSSPTSLEDCISVNFDDADISKLEERERVLRSMADEIAADIAVLRQQPKLGPKGARAMQLIAEIMKGD